MKHKTVSLHTPAGVLSHSVVATIFIVAALIAAAPVVVSFYRSQGSTPHPPGLGAKPAVEAVPAPAPAAPHVAAPAAPAPLANLPVPDSYRLRTCDADDRERNNQVALQIIRTPAKKIGGTYVPPPSGCLGMPVLRAFHHLYPLANASSDIFYDIGFNKGYQSFEFLWLWNAGILATNATAATNPGQHTHPASKTRLLRLLSNVFVRRAEGECGDGRERVIPLPLSQRYAARREEIERQPLINIYGFDLNPTINVTASLLQQLLPPEQADALKFYNIAFNNVSGGSISIKYVPNAMSELNSIANQYHDSRGVVAPTIEVPIMSVDGTVQKFGLQDKTFMILKIDTEGFDPQVLAGAMNTLEKSKVRLLMFELSSLHVWAHTRVADVINTLEAFGFVCYYSYSPSRRLKSEVALLRLTGCLTDAIEEKELRGWSEIFCGNTRHSPDVVDMFDRVTIHADKWFGPGSQKVLCDEDAAATANCFTQA